MMNAEERWVDVEEVAAHLGVARDSIYRWIDSKGFPSHRVGRLLRFRLSEVDAWVKAGGANEKASSGPLPEGKPATGRRKPSRRGR